MSSLHSLIASGMVREHVPLGPYTTYKSGGPARYLAEVADTEALDDLVASGVVADMPVLVLGRGSNLVVADSGFDGLVIRLGPAFGVVEVDGTVVRAGGAAPLAQVARSSVDAALTGLEFFIGVPGSVGGAVRQNAGCFGTETRDRLLEASIVDLTDGRTGTFGPADLDLSYRHSNVMLDPGGAGSAVPGVAWGQRRRPNRTAPHHSVATRQPAGRDLQRRERLQEPDGHDGGGDHRLARAEDDECRRRCRVGQTRQLLRGRAIGHVRGHQKVGGRGQRPCFRGDRHHAGARDPIRRIR